MITQVTSPVQQLFPLCLACGTRMPLSKDWLTNTLSNFRGYFIIYSSAVTQKLNNSVSYFPQTWGNETVLLWFWMLYSNGTNSWSAPCPQFLLQFSASCRTKCTLLLAEWKHSLHLIAAKTRFARIFCENTRQSTQSAICTIYSSITQGFFFLKIKIG